MNAPRLHAVWFGDERYERLAAVLTHTAERHCPDWAVEVVRIAPTDYSRSRRVGAVGLVTNVQKFEHWVRAVEQADDGDRLLLIDADCFVMRPLDDVWEDDFDLAYTQRTGSRYPMNGGVLFVRVDPAVREFFGRWWRENLRLLADAKAHRPWQRRYAGINQASFGLLHETGGMDGLRVRALDCDEWNCEDSAWSRYSSGRTRIVHAKSALRWAIFPEGAPYQYRSPALHVRRLAKLWHGLEAESITHGGVAA